MLREIPDNTVRPVMQETIVCQLQFERIFTWTRINTGTITIMTVKADVSRIPRRVRLQNIKSMGFDSNSQVRGN